MRTLCLQELAATEVRNMEDLIHTLLDLQRWSGGSRYGRLAGA